MFVLSNQGRRAPTGDDYLESADDDSRILEAIPCTSCVPKAPNYNTQAITTGSETSATSRNKNKKYPPLPTKRSFSFQRDGASGS